MEKGLLALKTSLLPASGLADGVLPSPAEQWQRDLCLMLVWTVLLTSVAAADFVRTCWRRILQTGLLRLTEETEPLPRSHHFVSITKDAANVDVSSTNKTGITSA